MTIDQAITQGLKEIRCEPWNPYCRLKLPTKELDGRHGPWGYLIDPAGNLAAGFITEHSISLLLIPMPGQMSVDPTVDEWEEWIRPKDYDAKFPPREIK